MTSYYLPSELKELGLSSYGKNVFISRKASIYNPGFISIGNNVRIDDFCVISGGSGITLGSFVHIACFAALFGGSQIEIGDFCALSARATIYSESDDYSGISMTNPMIQDKYKPAFSKGKVIMRKHAIVGAHSVVMPGVILEEGAAVGACSMVGKHCNAWTIYSGIPARPFIARAKNILELEKIFLVENS